MTPSVAPRETARPASPDLPFDVEADIVVVGGGGGGLATALFARWLGNEVVLLEKAAELGGTANKAAFWYWVPNNKHDAAQPASRTRKEDCIRYMARLSRPSATTPTSPTFGMTEWEYDCATPRSTTTPRPATELLAERGALEYRHCDRRARLLGRDPGGQGAERPRAVPKDACGVDVGRRRGRGPHAWAASRAPTASTSAPATACSG